MSEQNTSPVVRDENPRGDRKERVGVVSSAAMNKTIVVKVEKLKPHAIYQKGLKQTKKFAAHDENNVCQVGDVVRIRETRPLSKTKRWRLVEVVKKAD